jgi:hypothetical protein
MFWCDPRLVRGSGIGLTNAMRVEFSAECPTRRGAAGGSAFRANPARNYESIFVGIAGGGVGQPLRHSAANRRTAPSQTERCDERR